MPGTDRLRRACDRCHSLKERCRWSGEALKCDRCSRLDQECYTNRPAHKIGRKPRNRPINLHAISGIKTSEAPAVLGNESPGDGESISKGHWRPPGNLDNASSSKTSIWSPRGRRGSCLSGSVARAATESSMTCPPGARRASDAPTPDSLSGLAADIRKSFSTLDVLDDLERSVLELCFAREEAVGQFTIGKSFHRMHQRDLLTRLSNATVQLKDGFICCGAMFAQSLNVVLPPEVLEMCQHRAATAVSSLRALEIASREDVSTCLALGVVVTTFALYVAGGETVSICRWVLTQLKPYYEAGIDLEADELSFLNCLIFTEIVECLLRGQLPTMRFKPAMETEVDRYFGLSTPIMAYLYDICLISHKLHKAATPRGRQRLLSQLDLVEQNARKWRPGVRHDLVDHFDQAEVVNILAQAKGLRLTVLLLIHRLRHPFGEHLEHGRALSEAIITEIELAKQITNHVAEGLDLCVIVSFFELEEGSDRDDALAKIDILVQYSQGFRDKLRGQLESIWSARDSGHVMYWHDMHQHLPP